MTPTFKQFLVEKNAATLAAAALATHWAIQFRDREPELAARFQKLIEVLIGAYSGSDVTFWSAPPVQSFLQAEAGRLSATITIWTKTQKTAEHLETILDLIPVMVKSNLPGWAAIPNKTFMYWGNGLRQEAGKFVSQLDGKKTAKALEINLVEDVK